MCVDNILNVCVNKRWKENESGAFCERGKSWIEKCEDGKLVYDNCPLGCIDGRGYCNECVNVMSRCAFVFDNGIWVEDDNKKKSCDDNLWIMSED